MTPRKRSYRKGPGYVLTEAIRQKMRESSRKRWQDKRQRDHLSKLRTITLPVEKIISLYKSGLSLRKIAPRFGVNYDTIWRRLKSEGVLIRQKGTTGHHWGKDHHKWKGSTAGYTALHTRLNRRFGKPKSCDVCGTSDPSKVYDWANLTGHYDDPKDFKRMCRKCHINFDFVKNGNRRNRKRKGVKRG